VLPTMTPIEIKSCVEFVKRFKKVWDVCAADWWACIEGKSWELGIKLQVRNVFFLVC
jgi:hypothetical protein